MVFQHKEEVEVYYRGRIFDGRIYKSDNAYYLCTNSPNFNGAFISNKLGYKYSWYFDLRDKVFPARHIRKKRSNPIITECPHCEKEISI